MVQLKKMKSISEEDRNKLTEILQTNDYVSSEESEEETDESDDEEHIKILMKKKLPWRSEYLNNWFKISDEKSEKRLKKLRKGGANYFNRREGGASSREEPEEAPEYAVQGLEEIE